jgi:signal transduction histidine kinase
VESVEHQGTTFIVTLPKGIASWLQKNT